MCMYLSSRTQCGTVWFVSRLKGIGKKSRPILVPKSDPLFPALERKRGLANLTPEAEFHPFLIPPSFCTVSKEEVGAWSDLE